MTKILVDIIESERGWGQRLDETKEFDTIEEAVAYVKEFNSHNDKETVPDWYLGVAMSKYPHLVVNINEPSLSGKAVEVLETAGIDPCPYLQDLCNADELTVTLQWVSVSEVPLTAADTIPGYTEFIEGLAKHLEKGENS